MKELEIIVAENGFIVRDDLGKGGMMGKSWAFESAETLAKHIKKWAEGNTRTTSNEAEAGPGTR